MYSTRFLLPAMLVAFTALGQEDLTGYFQPTVAFSYKLSPRFSQNAALKQRSFFLRDSRGDLKARQLDAVLYTKFLMSINSSLSFGLLYRNRQLFDPDLGNEVRLTQQYNLALKPGVVRYGHRLRAQQRIFSSRTIHRFRYRLALDGPFQGQKVDVGEAYWIGSLEPLLSVGRGMAPEVDIRLTAWVGFKINEVHKVQLGPEYRWEDFLGDLENILFIQASWVIYL